MRRVFNDDQLEKQFQKDGYAIVPFIDKDTVQYLKTKFEELQAISGGNLSFDDVGINSENSITYDFTFIDKNIQYKREVFKVITETFEEKVKQKFMKIRHKLQKSQRWDPTPQWSGA